MSKPVPEMAVFEGIAGKYLSAAGRSKYRPVADNKSSAGRERNRRIDIILEIPGG